MFLLHIKHLTCVSIEIEMLNMYITVLIRILACHLANKLCL